LQESLHAAGAAGFDAVGWHYIEVLSERMRTHTAKAHELLSDKLDKALHEFQVRFEVSQAQPDSMASAVSALMLQDMGPPIPGTVITSTKSGNWRDESPGVKKFRKQLSKISVQRQVTQAIAQAPQNAGPINSHMLVLRSLGLMREASPDYLNRFINYVDTLLSLEEAGKAAASPKKSTSVVKAKK
jgi:Protein of unknown function (DUF2894)